MHDVFENFESGYSAQRYKYRYRSRTQIEASQAKLNGERPEKEIKLQKGKKKFKANFL